jgi:hypothetical protein
MHAPAARLITPSPPGVGGERRQDINVHARAAPMNAPRSPGIGGEGWGEGKSSVAREPRRRHHQSAGRSFFTMSSLGR